jgi:hypothetical protein
MIRLARKPSLWVNFLGRLIFGVVWAGAFVALSWFVWPRRAETPTFILIILGFFDLLALGVIWDLVVRFWRTLTKKQPIVEIDKTSLTYGSTAQLRIVEEHPESVAQMNVHLVGESWVTSDHQSGSQRVIVKSYQSCFDEELLRLNVTQTEPITRMLQIRMPPAAPAEGVQWKIVVNTSLRQGGLIQHSYPIPVT